MWATIEKLRMRARVIAIQSSTTRTCASGRPEGRRSRAASALDLRAVGNGRVGLQHHAGADLGAGADADVGGDHAVAEDGAGSHPHAVPEDGALDPGVVADPRALADDAQRADAGAPTHLDLRAEHR